MPALRSSPVDGFSLAYERWGAGAPVVLLHGWPGMRTDYRALVPLLRDAADVVVPDLRGFGDSDKHAVRPADGYSAAAQARSVIGLMDELRLEAAVLAPPLPGAGERVLTPEAQREFWYQPFHQLDLAAELVDGRPDAVRRYLRHFWDHWSGPGFTLAQAELERLVERYAEPGAFVASIGWYRAGSGTVATSVAELADPPPEPIDVPTRVLWPEHDPLFPPAWGDRLDAYFSRLIVGALPCGHFSPLEAPGGFAAAIRAV